MLIQIVNGVALVNHDQFYNPDPIPIRITTPYTGRVKEPTPRIWTRRSRLVGIPCNVQTWDLAEERRHGHHSDRNRGRKARGHK